MLIQYVSIAEEYSTLDLQSDHNLVERQDARPTRHQVGIATNFIHFLVQVLKASRYIFINDRQMHI